MAVVYAVWLLVTSFGFSLYPQTLDCTVGFRVYGYYYRLLWPSDNWLHRMHFWLIVEWQLISTILLFMGNRYMAIGYTI